MTYPNFEEIDCVRMRTEFLPDRLYSGALERLLEEINFMSDEDSAILMAGKRIKVPRKQAGYGDEGLSYSFTGIDVKAQQWSDTPTLRSIKRYVVKELGVPVNYALVNLYRDGSDYIGYHSDDETDLDGGYPIISLSLGEPRQFRFRDKKSGQVYEEILHDNSLVEMHPPCQTLYKHSLVKKDGKRNGVKGKRLNITFRVMKR